MKQCLFQMKDAGQNDVGDDVDYFDENVIAIKAR